MGTLSIEESTSSFGFVGDVRWFWRCKSCLKDFKRFFVCLDFFVLAFCLRLFVLFGFFLCSFLVLACSLL